MISICCASFNARYDVEFFVEMLEQNNDPSIFEIVLCHDDRVVDGSKEMFEKLAAKYPNFRVVRNTKEDTIEYLGKVLDYYDQQNLFDARFRQQLRANLDLYKEGKLLDETGAFLWLSSGLLYNKAVMASKGELLVITPGDFIYLFKLRDLADYVAKRSRSGLYYGKPNAIWARITNIREDLVKAHIQEVYEGKVIPRPEYRWDTNKFYRNYLNCPATLDKYWLADIRNNRAINLDKPDWEQIYNFNRQSLKQDGGVQAGPCFHGFHVMTRKSYDAIGGFTEVYYSRAFPDDMMTKWGHAHFGYPEMPPEFSVGWIGEHEMILGGIEAVPSNWQEILAAKDPIWDKHPLPGNRCGKVYLHHGCVIKGPNGEDSQHPNHVHQFQADILRKIPKPVRFGS